MVSAAHNKAARTGMGCFINCDVMRHILPLEADHPKQIPNRSGQRVALPAKRLKLPQALVAEISGSPIFWMIVSFPRESTTAGNPTRRKTRVDSKSRLLAKNGGIVRLLSVS